MVATGQTTTKRTVISTEIIDVSNPTKSCVLDDKIIRQYQYASTGGMLGTTPVICGGLGNTDLHFEDNMSNECLLYGTSQKIMLNFKRAYHSSISLNNSMLWITGGAAYEAHKGQVNVVGSTEFVTREGAVNGPPIPEGKVLWYHCSVLFPGNGNVYLIGGTANNVLVANPSNGFTFAQGPLLMTDRGDHACGTMSIGTKSIIVAAGGYNLASVEILDPLSNQWVAGK